MDELTRALEERREEFDAHYALAIALEERIIAGEVVSIGETRLSVRHLLTLKSGLIVHIYNILEATMSRTMAMMGSAVGAAPSRQWSDNALREWLREHAVARVAGDEDARLNTMHAVTRKLFDENPLGQQHFRKPSGSWTDKLVAKFAKRLGVQFKLPQEMRLRIAPRPELGELSPIEFVAERRNAVAHGRRSFEDGARDLVLSQIRDLADTTLEYLALAIAAFQDHVTNNRHLAFAP